MPEPEATPKDGPSIGITIASVLLSLARNRPARRIAMIRYELGKLLVVEVEVLTPNALLDGFREKVLSEAVPV